jgi:protein SCO1
VNRPCEGAARRRAAGLLAAGLAALLLGAAVSCSGSSGASGAGSASGGGDGAVSVSPERKGTFAGATFATPQPRPAFTLTGTDGLPYDFQARTKGRPTLLFFGYTHCPDVCPTTMADVATALRDVPAQVRAKVEVVFVTTDPKRDTPKVLGDWLRHFDGDLPTRFVGLTGTQQQVQAAQRAAGVPLAEDDGQTHSTQLLLYGPDDVSRVFYLAGSTPADISHDLPIVAEGQQQ